MSSEREIEMLHCRYQSISKFLFKLDVIDMPILDRLWTEIVWYGYGK